MSILLQQGPEEIRRALALQLHTELLAVKLLRGDLRAYAMSDTKAPVFTDVEFRPLKVGSPKAGALRVPVEFHIWGEQRPGGRAFSIRCVFELVYKLAADYEPTPREIAAFKKGNVVFNCWPYFREFVHSSAARMNLEGLVVPLLRIQPRSGASDSPAPKRQPKPAPRKK